MNPIQEVKTRAEILHRHIQAGDHRALGRLRSLPSFRKTSYEALAAALVSVRRSHCLEVIAREFGFPNWPAAKKTLAGRECAEEFGAILCPKSCGAHFNLWYKTYAEAAEMRASNNGYLLAYRRQYVVVDRYYIESLGLDPADPDWAAMGFDWARPADIAARCRLYGKLLVRLPREAA
ncbi:MAG: hypothetical protein ABI811_14535 [Acidobacteriota bacterium]